MKFREYVNEVSKPGSRITKAEKERIEDMYLSKKVISMLRNKKIDGYSFNIEPMVGTFVWEKGNARIHITAFWEGEPGVGYESVDVESGELFFSGIDTSIMNYETMEGKSEKDYVDMYLKVAKKIINKYG